MVQRLNVKGVCLKNMTVDGQFPHLPVCVESLMPAHNNSTCAHLESRHTPLYNLRIILYQKLSGGVVAHSPVTLQGILAP